MLLKSTAPEQAQSARPAPKEGPKKIPPAPEKPSLIRSLLGIQRTAGNRAARGFFGAQVLQPKLRIGSRDDPLEREADRVADGLLGGAGADSVRPPAIGRAAAQAQRACNACRREEEREEEAARRPEPPEEEEELQLKEASPAAAPSLGAGVQSRIGALRGRGRPLASELRSFFEPRLGHDLSGVRIHSGPAASEVSRSIRARAFTLGQEVFFASGEFAPATRSGRHLLAHELTHVIQQTPETLRRKPSSESTAEFGGETIAEGGLEAVPSEAGDRREGAPHPDSWGHSAGSPAEDPGASPPGLIVDDKLSELASGQLRKSDFLKRLRRSVRSVADEAFAGSGQTSKGCPWIELSLRFYSSRSAQRIERDLVEYVPQAGQVRSALDYIPFVMERVRRSVQLWVETGELAGVPRRLPGQGLIGALSGAFPSGQGIFFKARPGGPRMADSPSSLQGQLGEGRPLEGAVRSRMQSAWGESFHQVRIHDDAPAARLADRLNARAFTVGRHVAFGRGEYRPGTLWGEGLIAHELAHVLQQRSLPPHVAPLAPSTRARTALEADADRSALGVMASLWGGIRRAGAALGPRLRSGLALQRCSPFDAGDFQVRGKLNRPNDLRNVYFDRREARLDDVEMEKIPRIIDRHGEDTNLTLNGFRSGDESAELASQRVDAVDAELGHERTEPPAHPAHSGERAKVPLPASGASRIDFRNVRKVEVLETPTGEESAPSQEPACEGASLVDCPDEPNAFTEALPVAQEWVSLAIEALEPSNLDEDSERGEATRQLLRDLFGGIDDDQDVRMQTGRGHASDIRTHLTNLLTQLGRLPDQHECHNRCNAACSGRRAAKNTGTGTDSLMTLCEENFFDPGRSQEANATTLIHESAHATTGLATSDLAYRSERRIRILPDSEALRNTDSYVLLVRLIARPGSIQIGPGQGDRIEGMDETQEQKAQIALAWLEKWLRTANFDTQILFDTVKRSVPGRSWATRDGDVFNRVTMQRIAPLFELTEPGNGPDFEPPSATDQRKLAAINDRYNRMVRVVRGRQITLTKTVGDDFWMRGSGGLGARAGDMVSLSLEFFQRPDTRDRVRRLLELLAQATPGISSGAVERYVEAADRMRQHRRLGPT